MREFPFTLGWRPSIPDCRDAPYEQKLRDVIRPGPLPRYVDHHHEVGPVWTQGGLGCCTGHGCGAAWVQDRFKLNLPYIMPSRLLAYWNGRYREGTTQTDAGATVRDVMKGIAADGLPPEELWPYDIAKFKVRPSQEAWKAAALHRATEYNSVAQDLDYIKAVLAAGYTIAFGFTVYQSFYRSPLRTLRSGMMDMPSGKALGGHCVLIVGYNSRNYLCYRNSWGAGVGDPDLPGHFWMPAAYATHPMLASDFWVIRTVGG